MTDDLPTALAADSSTLDRLLDRLLDEVPGERSADARQDETSLNIPEQLPLEQQRECIFYGLDDSTGPKPVSRFTAVIFPIGRYRFAVPLNMLEGVARVEDTVVALPGQPAWHGGVVRHRGRQLTLVDLSALLGLADVEPVSEPEHLLVLPGGRAGIVCDQSPEPFELTGDRIRWAHPMPQRPWLAGVLPDQMCVLMDVEDIARQIGHDSCL